MNFIFFYCRHFLSCERECCVVVQCFSREERWETKKVLLLVRTKKKKIAYFVMYEMVVVVVVVMDENGIWKMRF